MKGYKGDIEKKVQREVKHIDQQNINKSDEN